MSPAWAGYRTTAFTSNVSQANLLVAHRTIHGDIMGHPRDL